MLNLVIRNRPVYTLPVMLWKAKCFSPFIPHAHQNIICITASTSTDTGPAPTSLSHIPTHPPCPVCLLFGSPLHLSFLSLFLPHHFQHSVPPPLLIFFLFLVSLSPPHFHCTKPFFFSFFFHFFSLRASTTSLCIMFPSFPPPVFPFPNRMTAVTRHVKSLSAVQIFPTTMLTGNRRGKKNHKTSVDYIGKILNPIEISSITLFIFVPLR